MNGEREWHMEVRDTLHVSSASYAAGGGQFMSMPVGPDWYDDPDDPKAERWWDGSSWSPNRRRKQAGPPAPTPVAPPSQSYPAVPAYEPQTVQSYPSAESYPASAQGFPQSEYPSPAANPPTRQPPVTGRSGVGISEVISLLMALGGLAFIASAFATWGKVTKAGFIDGSGVTVSVHYPGIGNPSRRGRLSDVDGSFEFIPEDAFHTTNPGWIALAFGVLLVAIGAAYYFGWNRKAVSIVAAAAGAIALVVCISYLIDLRGTFGDPAVLPGEEFSPGLGLIAATALSVLTAVLGAAAFFHEQRWTSALK